MSDVTGSGTFELRGEVWAFTFPDGLTVTMSVAQIDLQYVTMEGARTDGPYDPEEVLARFIPDHEMGMSILGRLTLART